MKRLGVVLGLVLSAAACSRSSTAPAPIILAAPVTPPSVVGLSGQSNAFYLAPFLAWFVPIVGPTKGGSPIDAWASSGAQWLLLVPVLNQEPLRAFVWWQGESDEGNLSPYPQALTDLVGRVRLANHNPSLFVVICGANSYPGQQPLRDIQQEWARSDRFAVYVPSDDLPTAGNQHLTEDGYYTMASRIVAALPR